MVRIHMNEACMRHSMELSLWSFNDKLYRSMGISYMLYKPC